MNHLLFEIRFIANIYFLMIQKYLAQGLKWGMGESWLSVLYSNLANHNHWPKHPIIVLIQKHHIYISQSYCRQHNTSFSLWDSNYSLMYNFCANGLCRRDNKKHLKRYPQWWITIKYVYMVSRSKTPAPKNVFTKKQKAFEIW